MKKIILVTILFLIFFNNSFSDYSYNDYYKESLYYFINSPDKKDLEYIIDDTNRYCEQVYLEATRRREYTEIELAICSDLFAIKRQQELDYIMYMFNNRWIY